MSTVTARVVKNIIATSTEVPAGDLPRLALEAEQSLEDGLLKEKGITSPPSHDRFADVAGDGMLERVAVYDRYLVVLGPHFREGREYYFADIRGRRDRGANADVRSARRQRRRQRARSSPASAPGRQPNGERRSPCSRWVRATRRSSCSSMKWASTAPGGTLANEVRFGQEGGRPSIEISPGNAVGYSAATYREAVETSMDPLLLPVGGIKSQIYAWNGKGFTKAREEQTGPVFELSAPQLG